MLRYECAAGRSDPSDSIDIEIMAEWWQLLDTIPDRRGARRHLIQWCCIKCGSPWLREHDASSLFNCRMATGPCCGDPQLLFNYPGDTIDMLPACILYAELVQYYMPEVGWRQAMREWRHCRID